MKLSFVVELELFATNVRSQGMHLTVDLLSETSEVHGDGHLRPLEIELINLKRQVQSSKQALSQDKVQLGEKLDRFRPPEVFIHDLDKCSCLLRLRVKFNANDR